MSFSLQAPPPHRTETSAFDDSDADTASQRSISLSSPANSPRQSTSFPSSTSTKRASEPRTLDTDVSSEADDLSLYNRRESPSTSVAPSIYDDTSALPTYPPSLPGDTDSIASTSSRKARPESLLMNLSAPLVLGVALVDFNHLVGPRIEYFKGDIFEDEEVVKILPFLALPDGAHLSAEDYSYFHLVPSGRKPTTVFGISCNQQIAASALLVKTPDVTRSTVQKAVVVLASKPVFGPIRDKLGVITSALFAQRDFSQTDILDDFHSSLEAPLRSQLTESGFYIVETKAPTCGLRCVANLSVLAKPSSRRELVRTFRQKVLILVKALMLQSRVMFYGHPVERLCTYQYSLVALFPGLLQTLDDCGSPPLADRAPTLSRPNSLKTSDHKSMMAYMGLPLDLFGKDAIFQPYLPLQQLDMLRETKSWLCGSTNSIVTQQKEVDLLVNTETGVFEFRNPNLERAVSLTAADRKWMDSIVKDVNEGWDDGDPNKPASIRFKGSDDYLRSKFEEYISAALSSVRYGDFMAKGEGNGVIITGGIGDPKATDDFNPLWISEFKKTNAFEVWDRVTDPMLFDIIEPRHPCNEKPTVVSDLGLRLQEGIQDLKLDQQLAPARDAVARTFVAGSTGFFKAVEGVRGRWQQGSPSSTSLVDETKQPRTSASIDVPKAAEEIQSPEATPRPPSMAKRASNASTTSQSSQNSASSAQSDPNAPRASFTSWGSGLGSFISSRTSRFSFARAPTEPPSAPVPAPASPPDTPYPTRRDSLPRSSSPPPPLPPLPATQPTKPVLPPPNSHNTFEPTLSPVPDIQSPDGIGLAS
ncbi:late secretory pathway protein avl9 [Pleurotus pulmonarius]|nr:late secretory pathway protein avl9 [Pleurotus pulmonarius]